MFELYRRPTPKRPMTTWHHPRGAPVAPFAVAEDLGTESFGLFPGNHSARIATAVKGWWLIGSSSAIVWSAKQEVSTNLLSNVEDEGL